MPAHVGVVPEDLGIAAVTVDVHADTVKARHAAADGRVDAAQRGLPTSSAAALSAAIGKWQTDSAALFGRMVEHSIALRTSAAAYLRTDQDSGAAIKTVAGAIRPEDMKL